MSLLKDSCTKKVKEIALTRPETLLQVLPQPELPRLLGNHRVAQEAVQGAVHIGQDLEK